MLRALISVAAIGLVSSPALGTPFVTPEDAITIRVGEVKEVNLTLEPSGFAFGAFSLIFGVVGNTGLEIIAVNKGPSLLASVDLVGGRFTLSGEYDEDRLESVTLGSVTVRGLAVGGQMLLSNRSSATRQISQTEVEEVAVGGGSIVTVIPEPGTMALFGAGLVAIGLRRRR